MEQNKTCTNKKCTNNPLYTRASWKKNLQSNNYPPENATFLKSKCLMKIIFTVLAFNFKRLHFWQFLKCMRGFICNWGEKKKKPANYFKVLHKVLFTVNFIFKMLICIIYFVIFKSKTFNFALKHFILLQTDFWIKFFAIWIYENLKSSVSALRTRFNYMLPHLDMTLVKSVCTYI